MLVASIPCVMWITSASGASRLITPWQVPAKSSSTPKSERNVITTARTLTRGLGHRREEPSTVMRLGLGYDVDPECRRRCRGLRADRDGRRRELERGIRASGRRRGEYDEVGVRNRLRAQLYCAIERDEIRVELVHEKPPRALGAREEDAARGTRQLREEPLLGRLSRDEVDVPVGL